MATPKKTKRNPYGLTAKQKLAKDLMVASMKAGEGLKPAEAHQAIYSVKNKKSASEIASQNLDRLNFRQALLDGLIKRKILGKNSKTERRLRQGLDAIHERAEITGRDEKGKPVYTYVKKTDYRTRLAYIQEINKVAGVYAPEKKMMSKLNINLDLTTDQLRKRNQALQEELAT